MTTPLPHPSTLAKYGLLLEEWQVMYDKQAGACAVCGRDGLRLVIDHEHAVGWKNMADEERKRYVRGLLCNACNHYIVTRYVDAKKLRKAAAYIEAYERRKKRWKK